MSLMEAGFDILEWRNLHTRDKREILNRLNLKEGGSKEPRKPLTTHSSGTRCGQTSPKRIKLFKGHSAGPSRIRHVDSTPSK